MSKAWKFSATSFTPSPRSCLFFLPSFSTSLTSPPFSFKNCPVETLSRNSRPSFLETVLPKTLEKGEEKEQSSSCREGGEDRAEKRTFWWGTLPHLFQILLLEQGFLTSLYTSPKVKCRFRGHAPTQVDHSFWVWTLEICIYFGHAACRILVPRTRDWTHAFGSGNMES